VWPDAGVHRAAERLTWAPRSVLDGLRRTRPRPGRAHPPVVALLLVSGVVATALVTGVFARPLPDHLAGPGSFGWPALEAGRWLTLGTSFLLTRDWFMATTMPLALLAAYVPYERRAGHLRAFTAAGVGHVTGSLVLAVAGGALGWTGIPVLVRAAQNMDYGASMAVAAGVGALASRLDDRRLRNLAFAAVVLLLPVHHQMADWGHVVALPTGYLVDRVRRPVRAVAALTATAVFSAALVVAGAPGVDTLVESGRFSTRPASPLRAGPESRTSRVVRVGYVSPALRYRPEVAYVYVPDAASGPGRRLPVVVFLHGMPGGPDDWLQGGSAARVLDREIRARRIAPVIAVFPQADPYRDPRAGWLDVRGQEELASIEHDLLRAVARRFPVETSPRTAAVVGFGAGGAGAGVLAARDPLFRSQVTAPRGRHLRPNVVAALDVLEREGWARPTGS